MPATTRRRTDLTTMRPKSRASLVPATVLNPNKRVLTPRPKPTPQPADQKPKARPRRDTPPTQSELAWALAQRLALFLWANRREPNLWLSIVVSAEIVVLLTLLVLYRLLTP